jgi:hypothetical protein
MVMSNRTIIFLIFILPNLLLVLLLSLLPIIINLVNVTDAVLNATSFPSDTVTVYNVNLELGLLFGVVSIAFAIWFGFGNKLNDFLRASKKREVDEKIAMFYGYAAEVQSWQKSGIDVDLMLEKILADIRAVGRIKKSIKDEQKEAVITAKNRLVNKMQIAMYEQHASRIEEVFKSNLWS